MTATLPATAAAESIVLDNGLTVSIETGWASPHAAVAWHFPVGMVDDPDSAPGLAHLVEHLLFQDVGHGAGETPAERHRAEGGGFRGGTTHLEYTDFSRRVAPERLVDAVAFDSRRFTAPAFTKADLDDQRTAVDREARGRRVAPLAEFPWPLLHRAVEGDPATGHDGIGSEASLASVSVADCDAFFRERYVPDGAHVTVVAHTITDHDRRDLLAALAAIPPGDRATRRHAPTLPIPAQSYTMTAADLDDEVVFTAAVLPGLAGDVTAHLATLAAFDAAAAVCGTTSASRGAFGLLDTFRRDYALSAARDTGDAAALLARFDAAWDDIRRGGSRSWRGAVGRLFADVHALTSDVSERARFRGRLACLGARTTPEDVVATVGALAVDDIPDAARFFVTVTPSGDRPAPPRKDTR